MRAAAIAVLALLLTACGPTTGPSPQTQLSTAPAPPLQPTQPQPTATSTQPAAEPVNVTVPNVVGMNHQAAQDTMQAAGLYYLTEEDATGKGRLLINDRNWTVVEQRPAAGATVAKTEKILLRSKKLGE